LSPGRPPLAVEILQRLERSYGRRPWRTYGPPLDILVGTILSQNTNDRNSDLAMARLTKALPTWDAVADAPLATIAAAIRPAGLHRQKAVTIRKALRTIRADHGRLTLDFLRRWPTDRIREYLGAMPGVGPKTVACTLLFSDLRRPVLPVDTHVHRVSRRLGLIPAKAGAAQAHDLLAGLVPSRKVYAFHVLLIEHGRKTCHSRRPECEHCDLFVLCPSRFKETV
jgi:endonuclease-3